MNKYCDRVLMKLIVVLLLVMASEAIATDSDVVLDLSGSTSCRQVAGKEIMEIKDTHPPGPGDTKTVMGPGEQRITYTIGKSEDTLAEWHISSEKSLIPVNATMLTYTIGKSFTILTTRKAGTRVFHFANEGATRDTEERAAGPIKEITFCYGSRVPPEPIDKCNDTLCEGLGTPPPDRVLISLDPKADQWGVEACACGLNLVRCNPAAQGGAPDACPSGKPLLEVPVEIQAVRDESFICIVIGGKRRCFTRK